MDGIKFNVGSSREAEAGLIGSPLLRRTRGTQENVDETMMQSQWKRTAPPL